jgi:hypothetical protein
VALLSDFVAAPRGAQGDHRTRISANDRGRGR